eukprot:Skav204143  [mRNA]  locus=scaffold903:83453:83884:+ [translate_table: standard]
MDQAGEATTVETFAASEQAEDQSTDIDESQVRELTEWATKEKLSWSFRKQTAALVRQGGLGMVTGQWLQEIGIQLLGMRTKILEACQRKLSGNLKKTRFGDTVWYDPVLTNRPLGKNTWMDLGHLEKSHDKAQKVGVFIMGLL